MDTIKLKQKLATCMVSLLLCIPHVTIAMAAPAPVPAPRGPVPLSAAELYEIYHDKTWVWGTGGGRFESQGRRFVAFTNDKGNQSWAEGKWDVNDTGKLCIRATWTNAEGPGANATCFGHQKIGNVIYQRRHPDGKWYIFRHARARSGDEYRKLVPADNITMKAIALRQSLMARNQEGVRP